MTDYPCESGQCVEIVDLGAISNHPLKYPVELNATEKPGQVPVKMTYAEFADFANDVHAGRYAEIWAKGLAEKLRRAEAAK